MAIQYYQFTDTGEKYAQDKSTGHVDRVDVIPTGAPVIQTLSRYASNYGITSSSSSPAVPTTGSSSPPPTSSSSPDLTYIPPSKEIPKPPIPDSVYNQIRQEVINGQRSSSDALAYLKALSTSAQYTGGYDPQRLFPTGMTYTDSLGRSRVFDSSGTGTGPLADSTLGKSIIANPSGTTPSSSTTVPNVPVPKYDDAATALLNNPALSDSQKQGLQKLFEAISSGDQAQASKMVAAFNAATQFSDPYFKAQVSILSDALKRGLAQNEGDLAYNEKVLNQTLNDLRSNTAASKDQLSFQNQQELDKLARSYETDLGTLRDSLAASGKASSSVRSRAEQLLNASNEGLVESSNRNYNYQSGNLNRALASKETDTADQLSYLQDKATKDRISALRKTEEQVGSTALGTLGYSGSDILGGVGGEIPRKKVTDALSAATSWVF